MAGSLILIFVGVQIAIALSGATEPAIFQGRNFEVFVEKKTYHDAQKFCEDRGETLFEIRTEAARVFVISKTTEINLPVWVAVTDRTNETSSKNGDPVRSGRRNRNNRCTLMTKCGKLGKRNCGRKHAFICQSPEIVVNDRGECPRFGYPTNNGTCYQFVRNTTLFFKQTEFFCRIIGGKLPEPRTERVRDALVKEINRNYRNVSEETKKVWLGATDSNGEGAFVWKSDGEPVDFPVDWWDEGQPDNINGTEDCLFMDFDGKVSDTPCTDRWRIVCEIPGTPPKPCSAYVNGKCFQYMTLRKSYQFAKGDCSRHSGRIAEIQTEAYQDALLSIIGEFEEPVWILADDLRDIPRELWAPGQPDYFNGCSQCALLFPDGLVYGGPCEVPNHFFCLV